MSQPFDLVVASHLRWSFVWQRPQQLLSRLAQHRRVLFIEEPIYVDGSSRTGVPVLERVHDNITVLAPRVGRPDREGTPIWSDRESIAKQVRYAMQMLRFERTALWFYTPLPEFLLHVVEPDIVAYDVMDELANFKMAPPQMKEQENRLLRRADVVFTGGASLYEAKRSINPNTHLFASGVDGAHYAKACLDETPVAPGLAAVQAPRATYVGVIDERLDYDIIAHLAAARPDVEFMMVGPIVKVDPASLPQAPNIHYLGQQDYNDLPGILKGTEVCLMPFARNDATKFISPTKTLEYMATHRPIVSTPIKDVERFYSDIVYLANDKHQFVAQLDAALNETAEERAHKRLREDKILAEHAWDAIAANMNQLLVTANDAAARKAKVARGPVRMPVRRSAPTARAEAPSTGAATPLA